MNKKEFTLLGRVVFARLVTSHVVCTRFHMNKTQYKSLHYLVFTMAKPSVVFEILGWIYMSCCSIIFIRKHGEQLKLDIFGLFQRWRTDSTPKKVYKTRRTREESDFRTLYRFDRENFDTVVRIFLSDEAFDARGGGLTPAQKMEIFLRYYVTLAIQASK